MTEYECWEEADPSNVFGFDADMAEEAARKMYFELGVSSERRCIICVRDETLYVSRYAVHAIVQCRLLPEVTP